MSVRYENPTNPTLSRPSNPSSLNRRWKLEDLSELAGPPISSEETFGTYAKEDEEFAIERLRRSLRFCLLVDYSIESRDMLAPGEYSYWLNVRRIGVELTKARSSCTCAVPQELQYAECMDSAVWKPAQAISVPAGVVMQMLRQFWLSTNWMGRHRSLMSHLPYRGLDMLTTKLLIDKGISIRVFNRAEDWWAVKTIEKECNAQDKIWFESTEGPDTFEPTEHAKEFEGAMPNGQEVGQGSRSGLVIPRKKCHRCCSRRGFVLRPGKVLPRAECR